jgi:hypothetical protein
LPSQGSRKRGIPRHLADLREREAMAMIGD